MKTTLITFKYALFIFILLSIYFLALEGGSLSDIFLLKLFNLGIVGLGVYLHISEKSEKGEFNYVELLIFGMRSASIGIILAVIGLYAYLNFYKDPEYFKTLSSTLIPANHLIEYCFAIFIEGFSSSLIIVYCIMQYFKNVKSKINKTFNH